MSLYFEKWFSINPKKESLVVNFMKSQNGKNIKNRFVINYINKETQQNKKYYIDVDYLDKKATTVAYLNEK